MARVIGEIIGIIGDNGCFDGPTWQRSISRSIAEQSPTTHLYVFSGISREIIGHLRRIVGIDEVSVLDDNTLVSPLASRNPRLQLHKNALSWGLWSLAA